MIARWRFAWSWIVAAVWRGPRRPHVLAKSCWCHPTTIEVD